MPTSSIERRDLSPQPFLFVRAKAGRHEDRQGHRRSPEEAAMQAELAIARRLTARSRRIRGCQGLAHRDLLASGTVRRRHLLDQ
jgi:hypothetical protein